MAPINKPKVIKDYNTKRPHSSLGYMTPEEYVNRNDEMTEEKEVSILQL